MGLSKRGEITVRKKVLGILTFNRASNYGAVLQAYALKEVCEELGWEVHVINYLRGVADDRPAPIRRFLAAGNKKQALVPLVRTSLSYVGDRRRWKAFQSFRETHLNETAACTTAEEVAALGFDAYIAGSDQIWNYNITGGRFDPVYFGQLNSGAPCVVYGASAHDTPFPLDMELEFRKMLENTHAPLGIREQKLADYVSRLTGVSHPVVLDPTLLAGRKVLEKLPEGDAPKEPYILIYQIDANPASDICVKNLEKRFGCKAYTMTVPRLGDTHGRKGEAGPEQFLTLLKHAKFLVTNSFHGVALSLLLEKNFYVYENGGVMSRIDSLLEAVGLRSRKVKLVADIDPENVIDFAPVRDILGQMRQSSLEFLTDALAGRSHSRPAGEQPEFQLPPMEARRKQDCCGCSACADVCPVHAISMKPDEEGFRYPVIDSSACIHCGKCDRVCGFLPNRTREPGYELPKAFGIKHKDESTRISSRSGAAFVAFSDRILDQGGCVYGAAMMEDFSVRHIRATTRADRDRMKTAKYVQSDVTGIYPQVAEDLRQGKPVLFSGTPCQVAGLIAMLDAQRIDRTNLVCCDLVCHGVPSPALWKRYVNFVEQKYGQPIRQANFRDKRFGWDSHCESFTLEDGKKIVSRDYTDLFYEHIMMRPSCHNCHFANVNRVADLTLADFWGIEKNDPSFDDNRGVSLVLVSTAKGEALLEQAKPDLEWIRCDVANCMQPTLVKPTGVSPRREQFWRDYASMEFGAFLKKYTTPSAPIPRMKRGMKQLLYRVGIRKHP